MINQQLLQPESIAIIGGSNDVTKPGGKVLKNLLDHHFKGKLYVVNPKETKVQGLPCYNDARDLPPTDMAILAVPARLCPESVKILAETKSTKAFIILSAGFHEESQEGARLEEEIVETVNKTGGCLIGPNCIGVMTPYHTSVFTTPIPELVPDGVDFISGSGATAVFIMETAITNGLRFSSVFSVGNSAQIGVEEVLEYLDTHFDPLQSSKIKLLYIESIAKPDKLLKHASSLIEKGCKIAAIKAGTSAAGSRAASSHTGALSSSDTAVDALLRKAGIVRCHSRQELATVGGIFTHPPLPGNRMAIITHAGGPAVMLTDALSNNGIEIPPLESPELLSKLYPGSSVANPIDFLATGTASQLAEIIDYCENRFDQIDAMAVIFGSPGLFEVYDVYKVLDEKNAQLSQTYLPNSYLHHQREKEIEYFISLGHVNFPDEVVFGNALTKVYNTPPPAAPPTIIDINKELIRKVIDKTSSGYLPPQDVQKLLDASGIPRAKEIVAQNMDEALQAAQLIGYPLVMKVVGPIHKTDVGGVALNISDLEQVKQNFAKLMAIEDAVGVLFQPMLSGTELFIGANWELKFGHLILCGIGGILIETLKDFSTALAPLSHDEAVSMIHNLKSYSLFKGVRGKEGINEGIFTDILLRVSSLLQAAPEIREMDLNPLLGNSKSMTTVDARIRIEK